jgi:regulator of sirC expression with transglutaminase-like and TPR domain
LSLVYLEICWRLGLPVWGVNLPKHFVVGYGLPGDSFYIDVFNQGRILTEDDCLALCQTPPSNRLAVEKEFSEPATKKTILFRMLSVLKQIYVAMENWEAAYNTVDLMFIVQPDQITELRDRGLLAYRLNHLHEAISDLERYLFLAPRNSDARWVDRQLEMMEEKLLRLN